LFSSYIIEEYKLLAQGACSDPSSREERPACFIEIPCLKRKKKQKTPINKQ
jgi:hypothetical protein